jgi:uncharacterized protein (TIGR02246 family)
MFGLQHLPREDPMSRRVIAVVLLSAVMPFGAWAAGRGPRSAIEAQSRKFEEAVAKGDAAAVAKLYAVDAELLPPGMPVVSGRGAIENFWKGGMEKAAKKITLGTRELHAAGDIATEIGTWRVEDATGKAAEGKSIVLWKKIGGVWQLYRDIWNDNTPPPAPPTK